eukprot:1140131-Pelagomonas_calceolata.AAC.2
MSRVGIHRWQLSILWLYSTHHGRRVTGAGVCPPVPDTPNYVQPNEAGITNAIARAESTAIAAAILQGHSHIATDSLSSLHQLIQICKQECKHSTQSSTLVRNSPTPIYLYKVKSHVGIAGNKCAGAIAKHQAIESTDTPALLADTTSPRVNFEGNPFHETTRIAFEGAARTHASESERPSSLALKFTRFLILHDALRAHMLSKHSLETSKALKG